MDLHTIKVVYELIPTYLNKTLYEFQSPVDLIWMTKGRELFFLTIYTADNILNESNKNSNDTF